MTVRQLADILREKVEKVGGKAALGRMLGVSGPAIFQYTNGAMPSFDVAIKWKQVFNENLIDLIFEEQSAMAAEPKAEYSTIKKKVDELLTELEKLNPDTK